MNWLSGRKSAVRLGLAGLAAAAALLAGCGNEEKAASSASVEVKGEPIRGEPIAPPPAASSLAVQDQEPATEAAAVTTPKAAEPIASSGSVATPAAKVASTPTVTTDGASPAPLASEVGTPESPLVVGFDKLASFKYDLPEGQVDTNTVAQTGAANQIPAPIKALNNQFISLKGFMLPLKVEKGLVTELLMMRDQSMCCYGTVPRINEWVSVKMVGTGVKPIMDQAVTLFGKLKVGEMYENGYLVGIYSLDGERMAGPLDM